MANHVRISIGADSSGFQRVMSDVEGKVHGFSHRLGEGLKESFVGLIGAGTVLALTEHLAEMAHQIELVSDRFDIAIDKVQMLQTIARRGGKDLSFMETVMRNLDKSRGLALRGETTDDIKRQGIFRQLGVSESDLKHLNDFDFLQKTALGSIGKTNGAQLLGTLAGPKNGNALAGMAKEFDDTDNIPVADAESIKALADAKREWGDLTEKIQREAIPVLVSVTKAVIDFCNNLKQGFQVAFAYVEGLINNIKSFSITGGIKGLVSGNNTAKNGALKNVWDFLIDKQGIKETFNGIWDSFANGGKKVVTGFFGEDAVKAAEDAATTMGQVTLEEDQKNAEEDAARKKAIADEEARRNGKRDNKPAPSNENNKNLLDKKELPGPATLKIGGTMGTDAQFRMQRLAETTNELLRQIVKNTTPANGVPTFEDNNGFQD